MMDTKVVPIEPTPEMIRAARRARINGTTMTACDWIDPASKEDLPSLGLTWPSMAYDRHALIEEDVHDVLFRTWWAAMIEAAPR